MIRQTILGGLLLALGAFAASAEAADTRVYELRVYHCNPGKLDLLNKRMAGGETDLFKKHGMALVGFFTPADEKDGKDQTLVYMVSHASREAAKASWKGFREDPNWVAMKTETEKDGAFVNKVESTFLAPTDYSPIAEPSAPSSPRTFELRTYVASPSKFDSLNKRFREHTMELFKKHGMTNVAYWSQFDPKPIDGDTLVYLLAYPDRASAKASWKAFGSDPAWQSVYKASEADGTKLAAKVISMFLVPTDYSPMK